MEEAIRTRGLRKVYPAAAPKKRGGAAPDNSGVVALDGLDLDVREGELFGMLGPNGAGKTTTIGILTTRVLPTSGSALVAGENVVSSATRVRSRIGVVPQRPNPDRGLDALENLVFHARYFGVSREEATRRADALLERFGISDKRNEKVDALSGGQQQRLMIARALIHEPRILFLDEPTVGLDPQTRLALWETLRELHKQGRTIILTTHYMEEADQLCDRVAIIDHGRLLAVDTPAALKQQAPGGTLVELTVDGDAATLSASASPIDGITRVEHAGSKLRAFSDRGGKVIPQLIDVAERAGRTVTDIHLYPPSLETLFIHLTGRKLD